MTIKQLKQYLQDEIQLKQGILNDPFLRSNMMDMDMGYHAMELEMYERILKLIEA